MTEDPRVPLAVAALAEHGIDGAEVSVEGHEREMAAVRVPARAWERMMGDEGASIAAAVKAAGFRYVALDLAGTDEPDADEPGAAGA